CIATSIADTVGKKQTSSRVRLLHTEADIRLPRAELDLWIGSDQATTVHLYEAYWAPVTEGAIGVFDTIWFLLAAGFNGIWFSMRKTFSRRMFGDTVELPLSFGTLAALSAALLGIVSILGLLLSAVILFAGA